MKIIFCLLLLSTALFAQEDTLSPVSLNELAARADLVALAQIRDTDYLKRRDIPVSGSAYLKVLIPYKMDQQADLVEVYEKGLHSGECYFPDVSVFEEGRRYLLFLVRDSEDPERYRGLPEGCALDVLVASDNSYALRYPVTGIELSDALAERARTISFSDEYAIAQDEAIPPALRNSMLNSGLIRTYQPPDSRDNTLPLPDQEPAGQRWQYTSGIPLHEVRRLIDPAALIH